MPYDEAQELEKGNLFSHWLGANSKFSNLLIQDVLYSASSRARSVRRRFKTASRSQASSLKTSGSKAGFYGLQVQDYMYLLNGSLANPVLMPAGLGTVSIEQHSKKYPEIHNADDQPVEESPAKLRSNVMDEAEVLVYVGDGTQSPSICPVALRGVAYGGNVDTQLAATQSWWSSSEMGWFQLTAVWILPGFPVRQNFAWFGALAVENEGDLSDKSNPWDLVIRNVDILDLRLRKPHLGTRITLHHMEISIREHCSTGNLEPILLVQLDFIKCRLIS
ncbi:hypothetical protein K438DRAFT_1790022 [Mycena galopus ATCC 62051]|nr:hypothetical protein K438DRAFT_1790022 [Mycena galopus ATCC 62051]